MNLRILRQESSKFARSYLSESQGRRRFICGAYVGRLGSQRVAIEHDEGWTALVQIGSQPRVLDYTDDRRFAGIAGEIALLEWLLP